MNPQDVIELRNKIDILNENYKDLMKIVNGLKIDHQLFIRGNGKIIPGISSKVAYDSNGLIISSDKLNESDIPELHIDKISGLRQILENKADASIIESLTIDTDKLYKSSKIYGSGSKINYDRNGFVVSSSDLTVEDIPNLPIDKIEGLRSIIELLESSKDNTQIVQNDDHNDVVPGVYTKVNVDSSGTVVSGSKLSYDDIPMELIIRINEIESKLPLFVQQSIIDPIKNSLLKKVDSIGSIQPGTYSKVKINSDGLVTHGESLTLKDLPELSIKDISELETVLRNKASVDDIMELNNILSGILSSIDKIGEVNKLKTHLEMKADASEVKSLSTRINSLQSLVDTLSNKIPNELILDQLQNIQQELSNISGRISVLEKKIL